LLREARRWDAELRTAEQQTIAAVDGTFLSGFYRVTVSAGRRNFTSTKVNVPDPGWPPSWPPGIAEIVGQPEASGRNLTLTVRKRAESIEKFVDETGTHVLYTAGTHFSYRARARITFPGRRWLEFPVRGIFRRHAIMTAVDQDGNNVAQYRVPSLRRRTVEITVHPDWTLTDELVLAMAISAPWLHSYFALPEGGG
jgi:hypothetical protein